MDAPSPQPRNGAPAPEDAWRRCIRQLVLRAPCLLPAVAVAGAALGGQCWGFALAAACVAYLLGMRRVLVMCLVCAAIVWLRTAQRDACAEDFAQRAQSGCALVVEGTVVDTLPHSCVVAPCNAPPVMLRGEMDFRCGDVVRAVGTLREPAPPLCPGMFDAAAWLRGQGIAADLDFIRGEVTGRPLSWARLRGCAIAWRDYLETRLMPPGTESDTRRQFLCALVLGDKRHADPGMMQDFRSAGCLHIFAVSGLHVGLVAGLLWLTVRLLRLRPAWARVLVLVLAGVYVLVTGLALPAVRAYLMLALVLGGAMLKRQVSLLNIWCFAAMVLLLFSPQQVGQSSFLLSFAVYGAICFGLRLCMNDRPWFGPDAYIPFRIMTRREKEIKSAESWVRGTVLVSIIAWLASLPLSIHFFHAFNLYGIPVNIAIAPLLPLVMGAGLLGLCLAPVPWLGDALGWLALKGAGWLVSVVSFFAALPCAYVPAQIPADSQEALVVSLGYGNSSCLLGNNGLLIDCGGDAAARYTLQPLLFHMGFTPAALLKTRTAESRCGGEPALRAWLPSLPSLPCGKRGVSLSLQTPAGSYRIYYPPEDLPKTPACNSAPVVTWHSAGSLAVYVGDASLATLEQVAEDLSPATLLILGHNPGQVVDAVTLRDLMPQARIILLPSAVRAGVSPHDFSPADPTPTEDSPSFLRLPLPLIPDD